MGNRPEPMAGPAAEAAEPRVQDRVRSMQHQALAETHNIREHQILEMLREELALAEHRVVLRPTEATRNTVEVVARLEGMTARLANPAVLQFSRPVAEAAVVRRHH